MSWVPVSFQHFDGKHIDGVFTNKMAEFAEFFFTVNQGMVIAPIAHGHPLKSLYFDFSSSPIGNGKAVCDPRVPSKVWCIITWYNDL